MDVSDITLPLFKASRASSWLKREWCVAGLVVDVSALACGDFVGDVTGVPRLSFAATLCEESAAARRRPGIHFIMTPAILSQVSKPI